MKRFVLISVLLGGLIALAQSLGVKSYTSSARSASSPSGTVDGVSLVNVGAYRVMACVPTGDRLDGGSLQAHIYDPNQGAWFRYSDKDLAVSENNNQSNCQMFIEESLEVPVGRLFFKPVDVGHMVALQDGGANFFATDGGSVTIQITTVKK